MTKLFRMLALLAGMALSSAGQGTTCPTFSAGDTNYIGKLNQLSSGCVATTGDAALPRAAAGGTVDVITATYSPALTLTDKTMAALIAAGANTSTTPTFAPNSLTAHTITGRGGAALVAGDIGPAGFVALLEYNLANTRWELLNPAKVRAASDLIGNVPVANLAGGTSASSSTFLRGDNSWATPGGTSPLTTKGDLWGFSTVDAAVAVGTNGQILTADSAQTAGVGWKSAINGVAIGTVTTANGFFSALTASSTAAFGSTVQIAGTGYLFLTERTAPTTPASGAMAVWADSTAKTLQTIDGTSSVASTTVVPDTGASNNFLTAISASGVISKAQPSFSNLSGSVTAAQMPALTGDCTTSAGAVAVTCATVNGNVGTFGSATKTVTVTANGKGFITAISEQTATPAIGSVTGLGAGVSALLGGTSSGTGGPAGTASPSFTGTVGAVAITATGTVQGATVTATGTVNDALGDVRGLIQNSRSAAYTTVLTDCGKHILHPAADTTARTFTIDSNANVAAPLGCMITIVNEHSAGVVTVSITTDTMRLAGPGSTGSRTMAADCVATALKITTTSWIISGGSCLT